MSILAGTGKDVPFTLGVAGDGGRSGFEPGVGVVGLLDAFVASRSAVVGCAWPLTPELAVDAVVIMAFFGNWSFAANSRGSSIGGGTNEEEGDGNGDALAGDSRVRERCGRSVSRST